MTASLGRLVHTMTAPLGRLAKTMAAPLGWLVYTMTDNKFLAKDSERKGVALQVTTLW
jgi:hypothetical protein